jgi:drug/metabolite transporter (DMT)-like permease
MGTLANAWHAPFPPRAGALWALAAGTLGGTALSIFYRALATGRMGLTAPVAAVLGAAIPTAFGMLTEGLPHPLQMVGFALAAAGIWLISRGEGGSPRPEGLSMAVLAGIGFAGFYLCIHQAGAASALWLAALSRAASLVTVALIVLFGGHLRNMNPAAVACGFFTGCLDVTGSALFVRAEQIGRLDSTVVLTSLYPAVTVLLARFFLKEQFTPWKAAGIGAALAAVPLIALR